MLLSQIHESYRTKKKNALKRRTEKGRMLMTLKELSQFHYLKQEIRRDEERLRELEAIATDTAVKLSGIPFGEGVSDIACQIADLRKELQEKMKEALTEHNRILRYVRAIDDSLTRQIFWLRFLDGLSWEMVADKIGGTSSDSVKKTCYRYLKRKK